MTSSSSEAVARPNVVLVIMDDLTWGDLACHGNPYTRTPNLDRLHKESTRFVRYLSGPVCTPARASLMTGRYPYRTRAIDTYCGRSMMDPSEVVIPQVLGAAGYRTGIFGKWHLGDNYPMRPCDKGFDESLVHCGGGLRQPGSPTANDGYFDPDLIHNGQIESTVGYCTDIYTDAAIRFIEENKDQPFFVYLATNAPHSPFEIGEEWVERYRKMGINETHARVYGMVENIDTNVGKVLDCLDDLKLAENTIVIYTSDHGSCQSSKHDGQMRFNAGLRDSKGTVYDGGLKVPCFWRWPARFAAGVDVDRIANPIDVLPTLASLCTAPAPRDVLIDGVDLSPLLLGEPNATWHDRHVFIQWHRGDVPRPWRNCAVVTQQYKLVDGRELYAATDWAEATDLADAHPQVVAELRHAYEAWFADVSTCRGPGTFDPPLIHVGTPHESPTVLTPQDRRTHGEDGWGENKFGHWDVHFAREGNYQITLRFAQPITQPGMAHLQFGDVHRTVPLTAQMPSCTFADVPGKIGAGRVEAWIKLGEERSTVRWVDVR